MTKIDNGYNVLIVRRNTFSAFDNLVLRRKIMKKILIAIGVIIAVLFLAVPFNVFQKKMPVNNNDVIKALDAQGYTNIEIIDAQYLAVSQNDNASSAITYTVKATNPAGEDVEVYAYCGSSFKGNIIVKTK